MTEDWGEGASFANGGGGAPATPGDATWIHSFYTSVLWPIPGARWKAQASYITDLVATGELVLRNSRMVDDVRRWLQRPDRNFGWILLGDETHRNTAVRLASRENSMPSLRPRLVVNFRPAGALSSDCPDTASMGSGQ
jgi:hypothetical protein